MPEQLRQWYGAGVVGNEDENFLAGIVAFQSGSQCLTNGIVIKKLVVRGGCLDSDHRVTHSFCFPGKRQFLESQGELNTAVG